MEYATDTSVQHNRQPSSLMLRWAVLAMSCLAMTGVYYSFDIPAALHQQLKDYMNSNETNGTYPNFAVQFNLLYSVYSIPNIILPFFGGTLVDHFGAHNAAVLFALLTCIGQLLFAIGSQSKSWNMMLLGRTIYGFGGESISVATSALNAKWFQGKELALSFGINLAVSRLGSVLNNCISPFLVDRLADGVVGAIWFGVAMNIMSVLAVGVIVWLDWKGEQMCKELTNTNANGLEHDMLNASLLEEDCMYDNNNDGNKKQESQQQMVPLDEAEVKDAQFQISPPTSEPADVDDEEEGNDGKYCSAVALSCIHQLKSFQTMFWLLSASCVVVYGCVLPFNNVASGILLERNYFTEPSLLDSNDCKLQYPGQCTSGILTPSDGNPAFDQDGNMCPSVREGTHERPRIPTSINISKDVNNDSTTTWDKEAYNFDTLTYEDIDCNDSFWSEGCTKDYCEAQQKATETAGRIMSIPYILSASLSPFFGHVIDRIGRRAMIASFASVMLVVVHLALALLDGSPVLPLIGQGFAYSCYASVLWPSIPLTVEEQYTGTAFGAITAIQNIGLAAFPIIIAFIYNGSGGRYIPNVEFFFVGCAVIGSLLGVMLNIVDQRNGNVLNKVHFEEDTAGDGDGGIDNDELEYAAPLLPLEGTGDVI